MGYKIIIEDIPVKAGAEYIADHITKEFGRIARVEEDGE